MKDLKRIENSIDRTAHQLLEEMLAMVSTQVVIPVDELFKPVFSGIDANGFDQIKEVNQLLALFGDLIFYADHGGHSDEAKSRINRAADICLRTGEELLTRMFEASSPFWERYNSRKQLWRQSPPFPQSLSNPAEAAHAISRRYGMHFVATDALHFLNNQDNYVGYELVSQSLKWLLASHLLMVTGHVPEAVYTSRMALQITELMELPAYTQYALQLLSVHSKNATEPIQTITQPQ